MTIASATSRNDYVGNGAVDTYAYNFKIFSETNLLVTQRDTSDVESTLTLGVDYTVTGVGETSGGNVVLVAGNLTTNYVLTIRRVRPLLQSTDMRNQGQYFPETIEDTFDTLVMVDQQQQDTLDKSLVLPETVTGVSTELPVPVALKLFRWNASGTGLENIDAGDLSAVSTFGAGLNFSGGNLSIVNPNRLITAGGTVDAITGSSTPTPASLTNSLTVQVEASGANTTTTPTFNLDSFGAKTIVKGSNTALAVGDIAGANARIVLSYDASLDKWVLLNPATPNANYLEQDKGADVVSESALFTTASFPTDGTFVDITGTNAITSMLTSGKIGKIMTLQFDGALVLTHHATNLKLPSGQNILTVAGDIAVFREYASGDWVLVSYSRALGQGLFYGDGSDGVYSSGATGNIDGDVLYHTTYDINAGHVMTVNTGKGIVIMATGTVTIAGTLNANDIGATGGVENTGAGVDDGGIGDVGLCSSGGGGGGDGTSGAGGVGGAGDYSGRIVSGGAGGTVTNNGSAGTIHPITNPYSQEGRYGAGGGAGGGNVGAGDGGKGGGFIMIIAPTVIIEATATLDVSGEDGIAGSSSNGGGGGGGGGGTITIITRNYTDNGGTFTISGGAGGAGDGTGGDGGAGASGVTNIVIV